MAHDADHATQKQPHVTATPDNSTTRGDTATRATPDPRCPNCSAHFATNLANRPHTLPCQHRICAACVQSLGQNSSRTCPKCPMHFNNTNQALTDARAMLTLQKKIPENFKQLSENRPEDCSAWTRENPQNTNEPDEAYHARCFTALTHPAVEATLAQTPHMFSVPVPDNLVAALAATTAAQCRHEGCDFAATGEQIAQHEPACPNRTVSCSHEECTWR
eukprot:369400-Rhodomonas_salina.1